LFAFKDAFGCSIVLAGLVTGCKPQGTSAFTAHINLVYAVYLVFHLSGAIPLPAFKKKGIMLFGVFVVRPKHTDFTTKSQSHKDGIGNNSIYIPSQFSANIAHRKCENH